MPWDGKSAHPHVRGEDRSTWSLRTALGGSSPRAWGGLHRRVSLSRSGSPPRAWGGLVHHQAGDIDPHVRGEDVGVPPPEGGAAHPHVRGEDSAETAIGAPPGGSPPRAWGGPCSPTRRATASAAHPHVRGEDSASCTRRPRRAAHPHVRGEDVAVTVDTAGRPAHPHVRGEDDARKPQTCSAARLTPTCVGRTGPAAVHAAPARLTPTCVGRTHGVKATADRCSGSPPRAWGGRWPLRRWSTRQRLTPTCVGRTAADRRRGRCTAHPHVRGEDPRAAGCRLRRRLTPTCVGRTLVRATAHATRTAHPHVRGEDARSPQSPLPPAHPHVRGEDATRH